MAIGCSHYFGCSLLATRGRDGSFGAAARALVGCVALLVAVPLPALAQDQEAETVDPESQEVPSHEDGRRTIGRLPVNFGRGVVGVFSLDNLAPFIGSAVATGIAKATEDTFTRAGGRDTSLARFGHGFGDPVVVAGVAASLLAIGRASEGQRFRNVTYDVFIATGVNFLYTEAIKLAIDRTRPDESNNKSFPSGHTSNAFAWATVIHRHYGWQVGVPAYTLASLIGFSRIDRGSHFFSDVVAGAAVGYIVGRTIFRKDGDPLDGPQFSVVPVVGPSGQRGLLLRVLY